MFLGNCCMFVFMFLKTLHLSSFSLCCRSVVDCVLAEDLCILSFSASMGDLHLVWSCCSLDSHLLSVHLHQVLLQKEEQATAEG